MASYTLLELLPDGRRLVHQVDESLSISAQPGSLYSLIDPNTELPPQDLSLERQGDDLIIKVDDQQVVLITDAVPQQATYSADASLNPDSATLLSEVAVSGSIDQSATNGDAGSAQTSGGWSLPNIIGAVAAGGLVASSLDDDESAPASQVVINPFAGPFFSTLQVTVYNAETGEQLSQVNHDYGGAAGPYAPYIFANESNFSGRILVEVTDINDTGLDYTDETTDSGVSLGGSLRAMAEIDANGTASEISVTPLTELAAQRAGVSDDNQVSEEQLAVNQQIGDLFGVGDITGPVTTTLDEEFDTSDGEPDAAEQYGSVLAVLSGVDQDSGSASNTISQLLDIIEASNQEDTTELFSDAGLVELLASGADNYTENLDATELSNLGIESAVPNAPIVLNATNGINQAEYDEGIQVQLRGLDDVTVGQTIELRWSGGGRVTSFIFEAGPDTISSQGTATFDLAEQQEFYDQLLTQVDGFAEFIVSARVDDVEFGSPSPLIFFDFQGPSGASLGLLSDTGSSPSDGVTSDGRINVTGFEDNFSATDEVSVEYSTDGGTTWSASVSVVTDDLNNDDPTDDILDPNGFELSEGTYGAGSIQARLTDRAGNSTITGLDQAITVDQAAPTSSVPVVFDLVEGTSSSHSDRTFASDVQYDIYIRVESEQILDSNENLVVTTPFQDGHIWTGADNLNSDDRVFLIGDDGLPQTPRGEDATYAQLTAPRSTANGVIWGRLNQDAFTTSQVISLQEKRAGYLTSAGAFARNRDLTTLGDGSSSTLFPYDLWDGAWAAGPLLSDAPFATVLPRFPVFDLITDSGIDGDRITNNPQLSVPALPAGESLQYFLASTDVEPAADAAGWVDEYPVDANSADGEYFVWIRQVDVAGNASEATLLEFTLDTSAPSAPNSVDATVVVFDLINGASSDHSDRTFANDVQYDIYIQVSSTYEDADSSTSLIVFSEGQKWGGADGLGADDRIFLVGDGQYPRATPGGSFRVLNTADSVSIYWFNTNAAGSSRGDLAAQLNFGGRFERHFFNSTVLANNTELWDGSAEFGTDGVKHASLSELPIFGAPAVSVSLSEDSGADDSDGITNNPEISITGLPAGESLQYFLASTDVEPAADAAGWVDEYPIDDNSADGEYGVWIRQVDLAGNASEPTLLEFTLDTAAPEAPVIGVSNRTETVVFDLINGTSSDHSNRTFDSSVQYDIYIRVASRPAEFSDAFSQWSGGGNLNNDDRVILVGNGERPITVEGSFITRAVGNSNSFNWWVDSNTAPSPTPTPTNPDFVLNLAGYFQRLNIGTAGTVTTIGGDYLWDGTAPASFAGSELGQLVLAELPNFGPTGAPGAAITLVSDSGASDSDRVTNNSQLSITGLPAGESLQYFLASTDVEPAADAAGWVDEYPVDANSADGEYFVWIRQVDLAGNASQPTLLEFTLDTIAPPAPISGHTSLVIFDLVEGTSSGHSNRTFAADTQYDIYIRVDSDSEALEWDEGMQWSGADNLGSDDRFILVGDGSQVIGIDGGFVTATRTRETSYSTPDSPPTHQLMWHGSDTETGRAVGLLHTGEVYRNVGREIRETTRTISDGNDVSGSFFGFADLWVGSGVSLFGNQPATPFLNELPDFPVSIAPIIALQTDSGVDGDQITNNSALSESDLPAGHQLQYFLASDDSTPAADAAGWVNEYPIDDNSADGEYGVWIRQLDIAGNVSLPTLLEFTLDTTAPEAPIIGEPAGNTVVVFDLINGTSSDHSDRAFDADTTYDIYIQVRSTYENADQSTSLIEFSEGQQWKNGRGLGEDDRIILVGDGQVPQHRTVDSTSALQANVSSAKQLLVWSTSFETVVASLATSGFFNRRFYEATPLDDGTRLWSNVDAFRFNSDAINHPNLEQLPVFGVYVSLSEDSGIDGDNITNNPELSITALPAGESLQYFLASSDAKPDADAAGWVDDYPVDESSEDGEQFVWIRQVDVAGNASEPTLLQFTLDTTAPEAPTLATLFESGYDTGVSGNDGITNNLDGFNIVGSEIASTPYTGNLPDPNVDGEYSFTLAYEDVAGNRSEFVDFTIVLDSSAVATITLDSITADGEIDATEAAGNVAITGRVTGEFTTEDTLILTVNANPYTGVLDSDGNFSIDVAGSDLVADADTTVDASVEVTDVAGNFATVLDTQDYTVNTGPVIDTSVVIFDLVGDQSSSHSSRTFDATETYDIYIRIDSDSEALSLMASNQWTGAANLGSDDTVHLVGDGSFPAAIPGSPQSAKSTFATVNTIGWFGVPTFGPPPTMAVLAGAGTAPGIFYRIYGRAGGPTGTTGPTFGPPTTTTFGTPTTTFGTPTGPTFGPPTGTGTGTVPATIASSSVRIMDAGFGSLPVVGGPLMDVPAGLMTSQGLVS